MKNILSIIVLGLTIIGCTNKDVIIDSKTSNFKYNKLNIKFNKVELDSNKNILVYSALSDSIIYSISTSNMTYIIK